MALSGVGVVQVPDVDAEEVSQSNDRRRGDTDPSFGDLAEEVGRGGEGPPSGGAHGRGGHGVQHAHGSVGGGADTGKPVDCPMALGDEHGEGVVGGQSRGAERSACGAGAREQAPGVDGMEKMGKGMATKDADVVPACGTSHRVAVEVHRVSEEMDPAIAHVRADQDRFGRVRVEVGEATCPLNAAGEGGQVATVAGQPLGIVHQENPVQRARGGVGGGDGTAGFVSSNFAIYAVLHAGHGAPLPRTGPQSGGGRRTPVGPSHVHLKGAVMVLKGRGVGWGDPCGGQDGVLGGVVDGAVRVADIVRQDPRLEAPSPAVPPYIVEDAEELHGGAVWGHPELVGRQDAALNQAGLVVVFNEGGRELPYRGQIGERPAVCNGAVWRLLWKVDEIRRVRLGHGHPTENAVDQVHDHRKLGVLQLSKQPVLQ